MPMNIDKTTVSEFSVHIFFLLTCFELVFDCNNRSSAEIQLF